MEWMIDASSGERTICIPLRLIVICSVIFSIQFVNQQTLRHFVDEVFYIEIYISRCGNDVYLFAKQND